MHVYPYSVRAQESEGSVLADEPSKPLDQTLRANGSGHVDGQALGGTLDDRRPFDRLAVAESVGELYDRAFALGEDVV